MPITIDEPFMRRVLNELRTMRISVPHVLGGGPEGVPLNALQIVPGHQNWATAARLSASVHNTGTALDRRVDGVGTELEQRIIGLNRYLDATDEVEALNSANAHEFASHLSGGDAFGPFSTNSPATSTTNSPATSSTDVPETQA